MVLGNSLLLIAAATLELFTTLFLVVADDPHKFQLSLPGCPSKCGNIAIPYPFGVGKGCYYSHSSDDTNYEITCDEKFTPPRSMYSNMEVLHIGLLEGQIHISNFASHTCYAKNGTEIHHNYPKLTMERFTLSTSENMFAAIGCDTYAWFEGTRHGRAYSTGCMTVCDTPQDVANETCSGLGCCQTAIPDGVTYIKIRAVSFNNHINVSYFNPCSSAFVVAKDAFTFSLANLSAVPQEANKLPVVFDWTIGTDNCSMAHANGSCLCKGNSVCEDSMLDAGYKCKCLPGYVGNPYLLDGCQDVDECADLHLNQCEKPEYCINTIGSFHCHCPKGFHGGGTKIDHCIPDKEIFSKAFKVTTGIGGGIIASILIGVWLYWKHEKKKLMKAREGFFLQNGGHFLHQKLSARDVSVEMVRIFTIEELERATNKYSDGNIIGKGGFGVVYEGILENNQVVAIKKSLKVDSKQCEQFINEVIVLSQLNNRHVVKLLGCCLETEVPLLVYEFVDNGTLYDHLHNERKASFLTWDTRLRIASEVAEVLSYLHGTISVPIIHRDMKSTNILLDKNYTAKVSDFGASRLVPMDKDHLATVVLGTCGYLDPEYLQTSELTQKSDVYSFGVVLVELLTRENAVCYDRPESERCLANFFLRNFKEDRLYEILDDKIARDAAMEQIKEVAHLAQWCLKLKGDERPTMKEVATELHRIRGIVGSHSLSRSSTLQQEERTGSLLINETIRMDNGEYGRGKTVDSSNNSQISSLLASLEYGR